MPRPKKERQCQWRSSSRSLKPIGVAMTALEKVYLQHDELESLRLCDLEGQTQEEAGVSMGISRGTVQRLLTSAREKTARALVHGHALIIKNLENIADEEE